MSCPICSTPESATIAAGIRAGAFVLILVTGVVITAIVGFGWRLWKLQPCDSEALAQGKGPEA